MGVKPANTPGNGTANAVGAELASVLPDDERPFWRRPELLRVNIAIFCLLLFSGSNGFDLSLMNGLLALPQWKEFMNQPTGAWLGFINAVYSLGCVVSYPPAAYMANRWGRKSPVYVGLFTTALGAALQAGAQNQGMFVAGRFFMGTAQGFMFSVPILMAENAYPTHRGVCTSMYNTGWYFGAVIAAWTTFGTREYDSWSWRLPSLLQILLPTIGIGGLVLMHESPRWLVSVGRADEARQNLASLHTGGDVDSPLIAFEMDEIEQTIRAEKEAEEASTWNDLWSTPGNRHRLFITVSLGMFAQWTGNGVVSYYLSIILDSVGIKSVRDQTLISACMQLWNLGWSIFAALMVDRAGRRFLFLSSATIMLISYILITALSGSFDTTQNAATGLAVIPFLFCYFTGYNLSLNPLVVAYPIEIWPYTMRSKGLAATQMISLACTFFNTFVNPIALEAIAWKYYFVFLAFLIVMLVSVYFWYPETRGVTLENVAWLFDGDQAKVGIASAENALKTSDLQHDHIEDDTQVNEEKEVQSE